MKWTPPDGIPVERNRHLQLDATGVHGTSVLAVLLIVSYGRASTGVDGHHHCVASPPCRISESIISNYRRINPARQRGESDQSPRERGRAVRSTGRPCLD